MLATRYLPIYDTLKQTFSKEMKINCSFWELLVSTIYKHVAKQSKTFTPKLVHFEIRK